MTFTVTSMEQVFPLPSSAVTVTKFAPRESVVGLTEIVSTSFSGSVIPETSLPEITAWQVASAV